MKRLAVLFVLVLGFASGGPASVSAFGVFPDLTLDSSDFDIFGAEIQTLLDEYEPVAERRWSNPKSGNAGIIQLTDMKSGPTGPCKTLQLFFKLKNQADLRHYTLTYCKQADGSWKF